jgi:DNA repair protein RadC
MFALPEFSISLKHKGKVKDCKRIMNSGDCAEVCRAVFDADTIEWVESFIVIALNRNNKTLGFYKVSSGGISGTVADPRVIYQFALLSNATSIIICHNHPSGNDQPSNQDKELTNKIAAAGKMLDIKLIDHIILTEDNYYSFADNGEI